MSDRGAFIVSLDFELNWGVHDVFTKEQYGENILGVRQAIPKILSLFRQYDIHATWATVGMLCFSDKKTLIDHFPTLLPTYVDQNFSPFGKMCDVGDHEDNDYYHFGESLVCEIVKVPHQEIGTHTFSHFYCLENGQNADQFKADIQAAKNIPCLKNLNIKSLVFPRNQTNRSYLTICKQMGIEAYRGNEQSRFYHASGYKGRNKMKRLIRLIDCYVNLTGHHTFKIQQVDLNCPINIQSSRFLRPYHPNLKAFEQLRLNRIIKGIEHAAKRGEVYHLWWHPHNFGKYTDENIAFLEKILHHVADMRERYGMQSMNMGEAAAALQYESNESLNPKVRGDINHSY